MSLVAAARTHVLP